MKYRKAILLTATVLVCAMPVIFSACSNATPATNAAADTSGTNGVTNEPFGQSSVPNTLVSTDQGSTTATTTPALAAGSSTANASFLDPNATSLLPGQSNPLQLVSSINAAEPLFTGNLQQFNLSELPDPSVINALYCAFATQYGTGNSHKYAYIMGLFVDVLGRLPASQEAYRAARSLANVNDPTSRQNTAMAFLRSPENTNTLAQVLFQTFVRRAPSQAEASYWQQQMELTANGGANARLEDFQTSLLASAEYFVLVRGRATGVPALKALINQIYIDVLGHTAQPAAMTYWYRVYTKAGGGQAGRTAIAAGIVKSDEATLRSTQMSYKLYLNRAATAAEGTQWVAAKNSSDVYYFDRNAQILASTEYLNDTYPRFGSELQDTFCEQDPPVPF